MNRKQNATLASWAAVVTAVIVLFALFFMFRREGSNPDIILPSDTDGLSDVNSPVEEIASAGELAPELIDITRENVATLIANMPRPAEYSSIGMTVIYGGGKSREWVHHLYVLGDYQRIERYEDGNLREKMIYTPDKVYIYLNEQTLDIARGDFSSDAAGLMPTYEDILKINTEDIAEVRYIRDVDAPGVWVSAHIASMDIEYSIGLENGLLTKTIAYQDGDIAWEFTLLELTPERPDDEMFILPSGAYVWE